MKRIKQVENNTKVSFELARKDIIRLQKEILSLRKDQEGIIRGIYNLSFVLQNRIKELEKNKSIKKEEIYVSSKVGKKFHIEDCPFAHKIKDSNKLIFDNKLAAISEDFTACECAA